jgi:hypothetical protein
MVCCCCLRDRARAHARADVQVQQAFTLMNASLDAFLAAVPLKYRQSRALV